MILAFGGDADAHVKWLRENLQQPVMTASQIEGIRNLLPVAHTVFIQPITYPWKTRLQLDPHPNVFMVGSAHQETTAGNFLHNFKEAGIKDVFVIEDEGDALRLRQRFAPQVINETETAVPPFL